MKVKPSQLEEGCILASDVFAETDYPLFKEKTVLSFEDINMLDIFLINAVEVEAVLANGERFAPEEVFVEEVQTEQRIVKEKTSSFLDYYLEAVKQYKNLFQSWQAGNRVDMFSIRACLLPLFERVSEQKNELIQIHHYSMKDEYLYHHAVAVGLLTAFLGSKLGYSKGEWMQMGFAGALADAGMAKISPRILSKKGPLSQSEYEELKKHPIHSYKMLKGMTGITDSLLLGVLQHHEREDGSGYPLGTDSKKIHGFSRIIAVADVYHAMTSERLYRSKKSPYRVLEAISKERFGKFDPTVVQTLVSNLANVSIGTRVRLTDGTEGEIVFIDPSEPTRPMIKKGSGEIIQLINQSNLHIEEII
ncbi:HD-GYP domain-containing protein [Halalkalibacterium ligniniphilum]|uniref:HD-GYP domain-containing protein n=1 Tax=Halalkalibacterium ligniniphilum TaxID=1134413 RepID=UPI000348FF6C|nr:HD-GYP domain-containing protein [Halalkalibacterium ligniniphilum]